MVLDGFWMVFEWFLSGFCVVLDGFGLVSGWFLLVFGGSLGEEHGSRTSDGLMKLQITCCF